MVISAGAARISPAVVSAVIIAAVLFMPWFASAAISGPPTSQPGVPGQSSPGSTPGDPRPGTPTGGPGTPPGVTHTNAVSIASAASIDGLNIGICFDEDLDATTATAPANYSINGGATTVTNVVLRPDGRSVVLQVGAPLRGLFTVAASGILNLSGSILALPAVTNVAVGLTGQNVGSPNRPGSNFTCNNERLEIVGCGLGVNGTGDQFYLAAKWIGGNFDARVRLVGLTGTDPGCRAGIYARESANSDSRGLSVSLNSPANGSNRLQMALRSAAAGQTFLVAEIVPSNADRWMRLERVGDTFTSYLSADGAVWVQIAQTNQPFGPAMLVGLGVSANNNSLLATGSFSNFRIRSGIALDAPSCSATQGFVLSFNTDYGVTYQVQFKTNLSDPLWQTLTTLVGDGLRRCITNSAPTDPARFYRVYIP